MGTNALSKSKNRYGEAFKAVDITVSGAVDLGTPAAHGSNIFGDMITSAAIHLEDDAVLTLNTGFGGQAKLESLTFTERGLSTFSLRIQFRIRQSSEYGDKSEDHRFYRF